MFGNPFSSIKRLIRFLTPRCESFTGAICSKIIHVNGKLLKQNIKFSVPLLYHCMTLKTITDVWGVGVDLLTAVRDDEAGFWEGRALFTSWQLGMSEDAEVDRRRRRYNRRLSRCRQGTDPRSSPALVVYVKHAHPDSEKTRLDTWSGPILPDWRCNNSLPCICWNYSKGVGKMRDASSSAVGGDQAGGWCESVLRPLIPDCWERWYVGQE